MTPGTRKLRTGKADWLIVGNAPEDVVISMVFKDSTLVSAKKAFVDYLYQDAERPDVFKNVMKKSFGVVAEIHAVFRITGDVVNVTKMGGE